MNSPTQSLLSFTFHNFADTEMLPVRLISCPPEAESRQDDSRFREVPQPRCERPQWVERGRQFVRLLGVSDSAHTLARAPEASCDETSDIGRRIDRAHLAWKFADT